MIRKVLLAIAPQRGAAPEWSLGFVEVAGGVRSGAFLTPDRARAKVFDVLFEEDFADLVELVRIVHLAHAQVEFFQTFEAP